jgi:hypothetical protein
MKYLINNTDIFAANGIQVIKTEGIFDGAPQRIIKRQWADKSGTDVDFTNVRLDETEYTLECLCLAATKQALVNQMEAFNNVFKVGLVVLSLRGEYRKAMLVYKEAEIKGKPYLAAGGQYAYLFTLRLTDANPAAQRWLTSTDLRDFVDYAGASPAYVFWGDGTRELLPDAGNYTHVYEAVGEIDIIIDHDDVSETEAYEWIINDRGLVFTVHNSFSLSFDFEGANYAQVDEFMLRIYQDNTVIFESNSRDHIVETIPIVVNGSSVIAIRYFSRNGFVWTETYLGSLAEIPVGENSGIYNLHAANAGITWFTVQAGLNKWDLDLSGNNLYVQTIDNIIFWVWNQAINGEYLPQYGSFDADGIIKLNGGTSVPPSATSLNRINQILAAYPTFTILYNAS